VGSSVRNLLHVILLARRALRWHLEICESVHPCLRPHIATDKLDRVWNESWPNKVCLQGLMDMTNSKIGHCRYRHGNKKRNVTSFQCNVIQGTAYKNAQFNPRLMAALMVHNLFQVIPQETNSTITRTLSAGSPIFIIHDLPLLLNWNLLQSYNYQYIKFSGAGIAQSV
jgi:hypothetical protein